LENRFIKSSPKYDGIYHKVLSDGDLTYYVRYKQGRIAKTVKIGKKSEGVNIAFCHQQRNDIINKAKFGENAPIIKHKQNAGVILKEVVEKYKQSKRLTPKTKQQLDYAVSTATAITKKEYLKDFTVDDINSIKNTLTNNGKSPQTINNFIGRISTIFNFAIDKELFKGLNPCKKVDKIKHNNTRERYLTLDEITALKEALNDKPQLMLFVEVSLSTGARLETITSISKKDINLIARTIQLQNHKSNNSYHGFISDTLLPLLTERYQELKNPNDTIIILTPKAIQKQLQPRLNKLFNQGLDTKDAKNRVVIHTLRHTFASHLAINNTPIFTIMKLLDHKDIKDTLRYAKLASDNGLKAVEKLWQ
jgi:integrase